MYALPMIAGVLCFSIILFAGLSLERYVSQVRIALATLLATHIALASTIFQRTNGSDAPVQAFLSRPVLPEAMWAKIVAILVPVCFMMLVLFLYRKLPRIINAFADIVWGASGTLLLFIITSIPISSTLLWILALAVGLVMMMWHIIDAERYLAITTSVVGGAMVSYLFTRFYYLPLWVAITLALLLVAMGLSIQLHGWYKRKRKERVFKGEEIA